jgi:hypothetical protein
MKKKKKKKKEEEEEKEKRKEKKRKKKKKKKTSFEKKKRCLPIQVRSAAMHENPWNSRTNKKMKEPARPRPPHASSIFTRCTHLEGIMQLIKIFCALPD